MIVLLSKSKNWCNFYYSLRAVFSLHIDNIILLLSVFCQIFEKSPISLPNPYHCRWFIFAFWLLLKIFSISFVLYSFAMIMSRWRFPFVYSVWHLGSSWISESVSLTNSVKFLPVYWKDFFLHALYYLLPKFWRVE